MTVGTDPHRPQLTRTRGIILLRFDARYRYLVVACGSALQIACSAPHQEPTPEAEVGTARQAAFIVRPGGPEGHNLDYNKLPAAVR